MATLLLGSALLFAGCTEDVVFQEDAQTPNGVWERNWNPTFSFEVSDTVSTHNVYLDLRHTGDYPFSNLYTFVTLKVPDSSKLGGYRGMHAGGSERALVRQGPGLHQQRPLSSPRSVQAPQ
jgi:gliding motility-associated lipoprotein GldH